MKGDRDKVVGRNIFGKRGVTERNKRMKRESLRCVRGLQRDVVYVG
jgi:hypothetical protein